MIVGLVSLCQNGWSLRLLGPMAFREEHGFGTKAATMDLTDTSSVNIRIMQPQQAMIGVTCYGAGEIKDRHSYSYPNPKRTAGV